MIAFGRIRAAMALVFTCCALAVIAAFTVPLSAVADEGAVTFSLSEDAAFVRAENGSTMALAKADIANVKAIDLSAYGLERYAIDDVPADSATLLQLLVYMADTYAPNGINDLIVSGYPGAAFLESYWGGNFNLVYYVNGSIPYDEQLKVGATCDQIIIHPGDDVVVARFSDSDFYADTNAGIRYFTDATGAIVREVSVEAGVPVNLSLIRARGNLFDPSVTARSSEAPCTVYWGTAVPTVVGGSTALGSVDTNALGAVTLTLDKSGTYYAWVDGGLSDILELQKGVFSPVSSPSAVRIVVAARQEDARQDQKDGSVPQVSSVTTSAKLNSTKKENTLAVKAKTVTISYKKLKKQTQKLSVAKVIAITKSGKGTLTYTKKSGNKRISVNKKSGKLTVKRGLKRGTYRVKVVVSASGNTQYKSVTKSIIIKVKVK